MRQGKQTLATVYPRARGKSVRDSAWMIRPIGLSLRARGRGKGPLSRPFMPRFIPAHAGKGGITELLSARRGVYPRARGRGIPQIAHAEIEFGLSPRARERASRAFGTIGTTRFIPARAGEGLDQRAAGVGIKVYPRARGRGRQRRPPSPGSNGLSPCVLVEGRGRFLFPPLPVRFIPARVGEGCRRPGPQSTLAVYPRARVGRRRETTPTFVGSTGLFACVGEGGEVWHQTRRSWIYFRACRGRVVVLDSCC